MTKEQSFELKIGDTLVQLPGPMEETLRIGNMVVVLLDMDQMQPDSEHFTRNVLAFDNGGRRMWQIEDAQLAFVNSDLGEQKCGYDHVHILDGRLLAYHPCGFRFVVDPTSGELVDREFVK